MAGGSVFNKIIKSKRYRIISFNTNASVALIFHNEGVLPMSCSCPTNSCTSYCYQQSHRLLCNCTVCNANYAFLSVLRFSKQVSYL